MNMKTMKLFFLLSILLGFTGCELIFNEEDIEAVVGSRIAYYWIVADADTYVECVKAGGGCTAIEADYTGRPLVTSHNALGVKRSYFNFPLPNFPAGTIVEEAYVEMFHSGSNEDGKTDDIAIDVSRIRTSWVADAVHYNNQPVLPGGGGEFLLKLESRDWSGTNNIASAMNQEIQNPNDFHGFVAFIARNEPGYEKGFYSNNDILTAADQMGRGPRLLLKVELPQGVSTQDVNFPNQHSDGNGSTIFGVQVRQSNDWPIEWNVTAHS